MMIIIIIAVVAFLSIYYLGGLLLDTFTCLQLSSQSLTIDIISRLGTGGLDRLESCSASQ